MSAALDGLNTSATRPIAIELLNAPAGLVAGRGIGLPTGDLILAIGYEDNARSVRWQLEKLASELGRTDFAIVEGTDVAPLWEALTEFQAARLGPITLVANLRPSRVAAFVERLDPAEWSAQRGRQRNRPRARDLRVEFGSGRSPDRRPAPHGDRKWWKSNREPMPDRLEEPPEGLGRTPSRLGDGQTSQSRPSIRITFSIPVDLWVESKHRQAHGESNT